MATSVLSDVHYSRYSVPRCGLVNHVLAEGPDGLQSHRSRSYEQTPRSYSTSPGHEHHRLLTRRTRERDPVAFPSTSSFVTSVHTERRCLLTRSLPSFPRLSITANVRIVHVLACQQSRWTRPLHPTRPAHHRTQPFSTMTDPLIRHTHECCKQTIQTRRTTTLGIIPIDSVGLYVCYVHVFV